MNRNLQLIKNTLIILLGKVCTQLISYLLLPLYTAILTADEYGTVDLLMTYITLIAPVATLQLEMAVFRYLVEQRGNRKGIEQVITNAVLGVIITISIFTIVYVSLSIIVVIPFSSYFLLCVFASALSSFMLQVIRGMGDNIGYALGSSITGISTIILNILFVAVFRWGVEGMLGSMMLSQFWGSCFLIKRSKILHYIKKKAINKKDLKKMLIYSYPLVPNGLSWWVISASDRTILSYFIGTSANGILAVATKFSTIVVNIFGIFNLSWTESVALHINDKDRDSFISDITNKCVTVFASGGALLIALIPFLFNLLIGKNFLEAYQYIPLLVIGSILNIMQTLYGIIYIGKKETKKISHSVIVAATINLIVNILLIKQCGIYASPISTIFAMLYLILYRYRDINKTMKIKIERRLIGIFLIEYLVVIYFYFGMSKSSQLMALCGTIILAYVLNHKSIESILKNIYRKIKDKQSSV